MQRCRKNTGGLGTVRGLLQAGARLHVEGLKAGAEGRGKRGLSGGTQGRG